MQVFTNEIGPGGAGSLQCAGSSVDSGQTKGVGVYVRVSLHINTMTGYCRVPM